MTVGVDKITVKPFKDDLEGKTYDPFLGRMREASSKIGTHYSWLLGKLVYFIANIYRDAWSITLDGDYNLFGQISYRTVLYNTDIDESGTKVRVTFEASAGENLKVDNCAIVERSAETADGTEVPTELLFSGASGFTILAGGTLVSDELIFDIDKTKDYLIIIDISNDIAQDAIRWTAGYGYFGGAGVPSYNLQAMTAPATPNASSVCVNKLEVR